jgi:hypothetical protein
MLSDEREAISRIRGALKASFPQTRFSVARFRRSYRGSTYGIRWTAGPPEAAVTQVVEPLRCSRLLLYYDGPLDEAARHECKCS